jgi:hypothetical protein
MYRDQFGNNGSGVVAIVGLVIFLIVAAFLVGGTALNALQWLQPKIGEAIAVLKQQEARQLQIQNDKGASLKL